MYPAGYPYPSLHLPLPPLQLCVPVWALVMGTTNRIIYNKHTLELSNYLASATRPPSPPWLLLPLHYIYIYMADMSAGQRPGWLIASRNRIKCITPEQMNGPNARHAAPCQRTGGQLLWAGRGVGGRVGSCCHAPL